MKHEFEHLTDVLTRDPSGPIKTYTKEIPITDALYKQVGLKISENNFELCFEDSFIIFKFVDDSCDFFTYNA